MTDVILEAMALRKEYTASSGLLGRSRESKIAVDGVDLVLRRGETTGLVGESGCGKSTLGKCLLQAVRPTSGSVVLHGANGVSELTRLSDRALKPLRPRMQMIFQDPFNSLNPNMTVRDLIGEPLLLMTNQSAAQREEAVKELMDAVGLNRMYMGRYAHAFSGGQRQRICIARAIATKPDFVVCDEAVSALDVSVRAQIINLLIDLQKSLNMAYLFISHDLSVVRHVSARIAVMYMGRIVEMGATDEVYDFPAHPYTRLLLDSVPTFDLARRRRIRMEEKNSAAEAADEPKAAAAGCTFHPRCKRRGNDPRCQKEAPPLADLGNGHKSACWLNGKEDEYEPVV